MEQVYVIKLKELPQPPPPPSPRNSNEQTINGIKVNSPFEGKDLNRQSLFGFSVFQLVLGFLSIIFAILGAYKDWTHAFGVCTGIFYILTSMAGILISEGPLSLPLEQPTPTPSTSLSWTSFSRSSTFLWITLAGQFVILIISTLFTWLTMFGIICTLNSTINLQISLIFANGLQFIFSLFSSFTICRILNPDFLIDYLPSWPDKPKVSSKVIVQTSIYPRVLKNGDFSRLLGPNCLVSLVPPSNNHNNRRLNAITNASPEGPRMVDQSTETDEQFEDINAHVLSSTPKYFSRSPSTISSISTTSMGSSHYVPSPEKEQLPVLGSSPTIEPTIEIEQEQQSTTSESAVTEEPIVSTIVQANVEIESSPEPEKENITSSTLSSDSPESDQDSYSNTECNRNDQMDCKPLQQSQHPHQITTTTTTAIH
ncbi:uncharacterized protein LOC128395906 [Panonychus citri]|uniref:uncharacterized protein LOC128395906 n=1 Tax=Panonychus citri TaxID=50023 RepID=UPI0023080354|nr:uncharacterized protein LOC128395906 [Panonychus citri]XP_053212366.1 uncharacterized protein LOC128395906 [Panonychus citri]XP_053212367.1 uncharacterized protein LOC128395906 [Panonychus citri]XP_053212368.1 uncharacterized protein LOC128395906 [Panonychus citri]